MNLWRLVILVFLELLQELDLFLAGQEVDSLNCEHQNCIRKLVTQEPCLEGKYTSVWNSQKQSKMAKCLPGVMWICCRQCPGQFQPPTWCSQLFGGNHRVWWSIPKRNFRFYKLADKNADFLKPSIPSRSSRFGDKTFLCLKLCLTSFTFCTIFTNKQFPTNFIKFIIINNQFAHIPSPQKNNALYFLLYPPKIMVLACR